MSESADLSKSPELSEDSSAAGADWAGAEAGSSSGSSSSPKMSPNASSMLCGLSSTSAEPKIFSSLTSEDAAGSSSRLVGKSICANGDAGAEDWVGSVSRSSVSSPKKFANAESTSLPEISSLGAASSSRVISVAAESIAELRELSRESIADSSTESSSTPRDLRAANGSSSAMENGDAGLAGSAGASSSVNSGAASSAGVSISMSRDLSKREPAASVSSAAGASSAGTSAVSDSAGASVVASAPRSISGIANSESPMAAAAAAPAAAAASATTSYSSFQNESSGSISWTRR